MLWKDKGFGVRFGEGFLEREGVFWRWGKGGVIFPEGKAKMK